MTFPTANIIVTENAQRQLNEILSNVIEYTGFEMTAIRLYEDIFDKIQYIGFMPLGIGRLRDDGYRETFVRRYRIVYKYFQNLNEVRIYAVIHSSRLYPRPNK